jgi:hypothetical protein
MPVATSALRVLQCDQLYLGFRELKRTRPETVGRDMLIGPPPGGTMAMVVWMKSGLGDRG